MRRVSVGFLAGCLPLLSGCATEPALAQPVSKPRIDLEATQKVETATFALGWFWHPESQFGILPGVVRTRVGYTGGSTKNPTYYTIGDHTETLQLDFDPTKITFEKIMEIFWSTHNHCKQPYSRQYLSAVFFHDEAQRKIALETRDRHAKKIGEKITTDILPLGEFYLAEDYHQKYMLKQARDIFREFRAMYPEDKDLLRSTAVARVNSYLGGHGTLEQLEREIAGFGLSEQAARRLRELVRQSQP